MQFDLDLDVDLDLGADTESGARHRFCTFQDSRNCYMLMEYVMGGEVSVAPSLPVFPCFDGPFCSLSLTP